MSDPATPGGGNSSFSAVTIPVLIGAVLALLAASVFSFVQLGQLRRDLNLAREDAALARKEVAEAREELAAQIGQFRENSTASTLTSKNTIDSLKAEIEATRRQARSVLGDAQKDANKKLGDLEAKLVRAQQEQAQNVAAVKDAVTQVRSDNDVTRASVSTVSQEVSAVKTSVDATKSELKSTIDALKKATGDLGIQSGLIATNANELAALRAQGDRDYFDFKALLKEKTPQRVGDLRIRLKATDLKKNQYTVEVIVDDKPVERKGRAVNEPVQFMFAGSAVPYEIVVNEIKKDMIVGYVAEPKARPGRK